MSQDRRQILQMLAAGKISADEAERLMAALEGAGHAPTIALEAPPRASRLKYLRVVIDAVGHKGPAKVNIRVPLALLRAGVKLSSLMPPQAREQVNDAMRKKGVAFDIGKISPENLDAMLEHLNDLTIQVDDGRATVRIFCE